MCGIAGFTQRQSRAPGASRAIVESMLESIAYRGPDQRDVHLTDRAAFGHLRLTIMEPDGGRQPRIHPRTGDTLIFNGEIYGHHSFDADIQAAGHEFRDHCDTESLFWLIQMHGVRKTAAMLDGMFAFAWYAKSDDTVYLARDAFGQKPLFYAVVNGELIFASEVKAMLRHPALQNCTPDVDALRLYLMMEYVGGDATGLQEIRQVPPGSMLTFRNGEVAIEAYWSPRQIEREISVDEGTATRKFEQLLQAAVGRQLVADVPVGIFLSGGLDSSIIAAMAKRQQNDIATFTIKFPQASFDESKFAEEVAAKIGTRHTTIELSRQHCVDGIAELVASVDQPFADSSFLPTYLLSKATRQHVTVALGGDGADELLLGYPNFKILRLARLLQAMPKMLGHAVGALAGMLPQSLGYMNRAFLLRQLSYGFGMPAATQSVHWMSALSAAEQDALWIGDDVASRRLEQQVSEQMEGDSGSMAESLQQHFLRYYLPNDILLKTDRASMYNSLEVRTPFLSSDLACYALTLPHSMLLRFGTGKHILRTLAASYLPASTIQRPKHGFAMPVSALVRGELRDIIEPVLLDPGNRIYEYLRRDVVAKTWRLHVSGKRDYGKKVWALFMLAIFFRNTFQSSGKK